MLVVQRAATFSSPDVHVLLFVVSACRICTWTCAQPSNVMGAREARFATPRSRLSWLVCLCCSWSCVSLIHLSSMRSTCSWPLRSWFSATSCVRLAPESARSCTCMLIGVIQSMFTCPHMHALCAIYFHYRLCYRYDLDWVCVCVCFHAVTGVLKCVSITALQMMCTLLKHAIRRV